MLKILEILVKIGPKNPPKKTRRFYENFPFPRDFRKPGVWDANFGRSGRAHRVFWGHFCHFSSIFGVNLLLKGFVPKNPEIAKNPVFGQKNRNFREKLAPEGKKFNPLYGPHF